MSLTYEIAPGETALTHRTFIIDGRLINVFDSQTGADRFKTDQEGDIAVVVRKRSYFARRSGLEMTVRVDGTVPDARLGAVQAAGQALVDEIEAMIEQEKAA